MLVMAALLMAPASLLAAPAGQGASQGIFGTLTEVDLGTDGEAWLVVEINKGVVALTVTPQTVIRLPGQGAGTLAALETGASVAILAYGGEAISILVASAKPTQARHFSGAVIATGEDGSVTLQNQDGNQLRALLLPATETALAVGDLATVVARRDARSGALIITGVAPAEQAVARLQTAMGLAGAANSGEKAALRQRLADQSASQLTALQRAARHDSHEIRLRVLERLETARQFLEQALAAAGAGRPAAQVTGVVTVGPTSDDESVTIQPEQGDAVELALEANTVITLGRQTLTPDDLEVGQRVIARYRIDTGTAIQIRLLPGDALERATAMALLQEGAGIGEITGYLSIDRSATPPAITITAPGTNATTRLELTEASQVRVLGVPVPLDSPLLMGMVTAQYDPETGMVIELNALAQETPNDRGISGVVYQLIARPSLPGNIIILTGDAQMVELTHIPETVIRRDGRQVTINETQAGDLVRSCSRYQESTKNLILLCLRSPQPLPIQGAIQDIRTGEGDAVLVTVVTLNLEIVTIAVDSATRLQRQGQHLDASDLAAGQRILSGRYNPVTGQALGLNIEATRQATTRGIIIAVDRGSGSVIIGAGTDQSVTLKVTASARIGRPGSREMTISDLEPGQMVAQAIYDSETMEVKLLALAPALIPSAITHGRPQP